MAGAEINLAFAYATIIAVVLAFFLGTLWGTNVGLLAVGFTFVACIIYGPSGVGNEVQDALPVAQLVLIFGLMFMSTVANENGTIEKICTIFMKAVRGKRWLLPFACSAMIFILTAVGEGMSVTALVCAPIMGIAKKAKINLSLMAICALHGNIAGQFFPTSSVSNSVATAMANFGVTGLRIKLCIWSLIINGILVFVTYILFGGLKLFKETETFELEVEGTANKFTTKNWISIISIIIFAVNIFTIRLNIGLVCLALGLANVIIFRKEVAISKILKMIPWNAVVMVVGAVTAINVMQTAGGTTVIVNAIHSMDIGIYSILLLVIAAGLISFYAQSTPVIITFIPLGLGLCNNMGRPELIPATMAAIAVASYMVDASPMSANGAQFFAAASSLEDDPRSVQKMFNMQFGWSMGVVFWGSALCWWLLVVLGL